MLSFRRPKIGLALGGGSAKGMAHIGVIKILEQNNIPIDFIAGTSIGSLIGGTYAALKDIKKIEDIALGTNWREIIPLLDPSIFDGFLGGEKITKFIELQIGKTDFSGLEIPFTAVATDLELGNAVHIKEGQLSKAIRASISLPLVFKPVKLDGKILTDGGLSEPVPVAAVKKMGAEIIIAVNLLSHSPDQDKKTFSNLGFYTIANSTINIMNHHLANHNMEEASLIIEPEVYNIGWKNILTREGTQKIIKIGEKAMSDKLPELHKMLGKKIFL